jgi:hypothetical protein
VRQEVAKQFAWSNRFMPTVRELVGYAIGPKMLTQSTFEQDTQEASDLVVLKGVDLRVAVRIRKHEYFTKYPTQFTIRNLGRGGAWTEFDKILVEGWGDFLFYGFANEAEDGLRAWFIGDLEVFRKTCESRGHLLSFSEHKNRGDDTSFAAFDVRDFPQSFVCAYHNEAIDQVGLF